MRIRAEEEVAEFMCHYVTQDRGERNFFVYIAQLLDRVEEHVGVDAGAVIHKGNAKDSGRQGPGAGEDANHEIASRDLLPALNIRGDLGASTAVHPGHVDSRLLKDPGGVLFGCCHQPGCGTSTVGDEDSHL